MGEYEHQWMREEIQKANGSTFANGTMTKSRSDMSNLFTSGSSAPTATAILKRQV